MKNKPNNARGKEKNNDKIKQIGIIMFSSLLFVVLLGCNSSPKGLPTKEIDINKSNANSNNDVVKKTSDEAKYLPDYPAPQDIIEDSETKYISGTKKNIPDIVRSIVDKDAHLLSELTVFPIEREYPLKSIETPQQLEDYFDTLFDDKFIDELKKSSIEDWQPCGWRGHSYNSGELWVYDNLIEVNYSSQKEQALKKKFIEEDRKSTRLDMNGWTPYECYTEVSGAFTFRIDRSMDRYRFALYYKGTPMTAQPDLLIYGSQRIEGSAGLLYFDFITEDNSSNACLFYDDDILDLNGKEYHVKTKR